MLHAPDYSNMSLGKLVKTVGDRKKLDKEVGVLMRYFPLFNFALSNRHKLLIERFFL